MTKYNKLSAALGSARGTAFSRGLDPENGIAYSIESVNNRL